MIKCRIILYFCFLILLSCENPQLSNQLEAEKQSLVYQRENLEDLKTQLAQQTEQIRSVIPGQIASYNLQIQNFKEYLLILKEAENDLSLAANHLLHEQATRTQLTRDQIEPEISQLERGIFLTQQQIAVWTNNTFTLTSDQRVLLQNLKNELISQQQQLDLLKGERVRASSEVLNQTRLIASLSQQQKEDLVVNQSVIQNEIFSLRSEIESLNKAYTQTRMSLLPLSQRVEQAQKIYDTQALKIKALEESIQKPAN